jgi:hypothetical protein
MLPKSSHSCKTRFLAENKEWLVTNLLIAAEME